MTYSTNNPKRWSDLYVWSSGGQIFSHPIQLGWVWVKPKLELTWPVDNLSFHFWSAHSFYLYIKKIINKFLCLTLSTKNKVLEKYKKSSKKLIIFFSRKIFLKIFPKTMRFIYIIRSAVTFVGLNKPAQVSSRKVDSLVLESSDRKWIPQ